MAFFNGKEYTKEELIRRAGNMKNIAEVRPQTRTAGKASGIKMLDVTCGELAYSVMEGRCLGIVNVKYKGMPYNFLSKVGPVHPSQADHKGKNFLRAITGGMLYTCGFSNVGGHYKNEEEGESRFHGRLRFIPAENVGVFEKWEGNDYIVGAKGEMRDCGLFFENIVLRREIYSKLGEKKIYIKDEIENESVYEAPFMLMYHVNVGFPVLGKDAKVYIPSKSVRPTTEATKSLMDQWQNVTEPVDNQIENVYSHELYHNAEGYCHAAVFNHENKLGVWVKFPYAVLPKMVEWRSMGSCDYCVGIMPANNNANSRQMEIDENTLRHIGAFEKISSGIELTYMDCEEDFEEFKKELDKCTL